MPKKERRNQRRKAPITGLRCFVAIRSGDAQTDAAYDRGINPTIRRLGLAPRRVDRLLHNERIDQKILKELNACHVVVADLSFARPSVYWEAGLAEGQKVPVIYTCRKDHFKPRPGDEFGNYKVHFDLQTKNIIRWTTPKDRRFRKELGKRLRYVLRPILQERAKADARKREEEAFAALPMADRRRGVVDDAIRHARAGGFSGRRRDADIDDARFAPRWFGVAQYAGQLSYDGTGGAHTALVLAVPKLTKSALREIRDEVTRRPIDERRAKAAGAARKTVVDHAIVVSFGPVSLALVGETLPRFARDQGMPWPAWSEGLQDLVTLPGKPLRRTVKIHVLGNVRSKRQAREAMKEVLSSIRSSRRR